MRESIAPQALGTSAGRGSAGSKACPVPELGTRCDLGQNVTARLPLGPRELAWTPVERRVRFLPKQKVLPHDPSNARNVLGRLRPARSLGAFGGDVGLPRFRRSRLARSRAMRGQHRFRALVRRLVQRRVQRLHGPVLVEDPRQQHGRARQRWWRNGQPAMRLEQCSPHGALPKLWPALDGVRKRVRNVPIEARREHSTQIEARAPRRRTHACTLQHAWSSADLRSSDAGGRGRDGERDPLGSFTRR